MEHQLAENNSIRSVGHNDGGRSDCAVLCEGTLGGSPIETRLQKANYEH